MEPKKNPASDVHRLRPALFFTGLSISTLILIVLFEWSVPVKMELTEHEPFKLPVTIVEEMKAYKLVELKKEIPQAKETNRFVEVKNDEPIAEKEVVMVEFQEPIESGEVLEINTNVVEAEPEPLEETTFIFVESMPEPVGGLKGFYELLSKHLKYPAFAKRNEITGKVIIEFVVRKDGSLSDFKILKSLCEPCDAEAIRVIQKSKWNAGKQRGKPVNVRMAQAIHFQLQK
ncbi:MAG: energy transducer TonB [Chryseotalea sp.]